MCGSTKLKIRLSSAPSECCNFFVTIVSEAGTAEEEDSEENDTPTPHPYTEENDTPTPPPKEEQARRVASEPVSHSHPTPAQHRPDSGISENSDCEDNSVPPRTASTHIHHQQDFGSSGKAHSRVDSTNGSSAGIDTLATRHSSEFRAESVSAEGSVTGSGPASQASSISSLSESDTDEGTGTCSHVLQVIFIMMYIHITRFWL